MDAPSRQRPAREERTRRLVPGMRRQTGPDATPLPRLGNTKLALLQGPTGLLYRCLGNKGHAGPRLNDLNRWSCPGVTRGERCDWPRGRQTSSSRTRPCERRKAHSRASRDGQRLNRLPANRRDATRRTRGKPLEHVRTNWLRDICRPNRCRPPSAWWGTTARRGFDCVIRPIRAAGVPKRQGIPVKDSSCGRVGSASRPER